ncbi:MAG TPA: ABC transporter ATP-binding protein [Opitutaceae bacterium]|nr:ABC transporter ATP-binding protein [Opitutaceae bacterium]
MSDGTPLVELRDVHRRFGEVRAVDGVSFDLRRGTACGFIGANGAGKTTTLRLLATLDQPDAGTIRIAGMDIVDRARDVRRLLGWMPDNTPTYVNATVVDYLDFFARAQGFRGAERARRLDETMAFTDLHPLARRPLKGLSKGQLQRLGLARMLLPDPQLLLLDEPAAGLDPKARLEFKAAVRVLRDQGKSLLISSHILSELEEMCDELLFIDAGRIVHQGTSAALRRDGGAGPAVTRVRISLVGEPGALAEWLAVQAGWRVVEALTDGLRAEFAQTGREALALELRRIVGAGHAVCGFQVEEERLEDVFVAVLHKTATNGRSGGNPPEMPAASVPPPLPPLS